MSLAETEAKIQKQLADIVKLGKSETGDKTKAALLKQVGDILKEAKTFEKTQADLNKRIKDAKKLQEDIDKYKKDWSAFIKDAVKLAAEVNKVPDTKARNYFMLANHLSAVGQTMLDDYP